jgi:hypothetical protein
MVQNVAVASGRQVSSAPRGKEQVSSAPRGKEQVSSAPRGKEQVSPAPRGWKESREPARPDMVKICVTVDPRTRKVTIQDVAGERGAQV